MLHRDRRPRPSQPDMSVRDCRSVAAREFVCGSELVLIDWVFSDRNIICHWIVRLDRDL